MIMCGVNALNGLFPFLRTPIKNIKTHRKKGVNALNGLFPFLHPMKKTNWTMTAAGVNALNGLFPFLPTRTYLRDRYSDMCQRPKRALSISTLYRKMDRGCDIQCVNALNGLFPFLRNSISLMKRKPLMDVSTP